MEAEVPVRDRLAAVRTDIPIADAAHLAQGMNPGTFTKVDHVHVVICVGWLPPPAL